MLPNQAKTKQEYKFKQFKKFGVCKATIYRWLKKIAKKVHMESKWVTKPSENLKRIDFYVCNLFLSEN